MLSTILLRYWVNIKQSKTHPLRKTKKVGFNWREYQKQCLLLNCI